MIIDWEKVHISFLTNQLDYQLMISKGAKRGKTRIECQFPALFYTPVLEFLKRDKQVQSVELLKKSLEFSRWSLLHDSRMAPDTQLG